MFNSIKEKILGAEYDYYDEQGYEAEEEVEVSQKQHPHLQPVQKTGSFLGGGGKVTPMHSNDKMEILNFTLDDYALTGNVCKHIKSRKPIVVNMNKLDVAQRQRALDYLTGATHALNGTITRVADNIFIFAPENVEVNADKAISKQRSNWEMDQSWGQEG